MVRAVDVGDMPPNVDDAEHRAVAEPNTILLGLVGSTVHGVTVDSADDRDEMGICIEPPEYVAGLKVFHQWVYRTQPEGARSGPGDIDRTVFSLRKWCRLALAGNPTVMLLLHVPDDQCAVLEEPGRVLRANRQWFASRRAGRAYLGYMERQRDRMTGERGQMRVNRPELIAAHGYDTKYAGMSSGSATRASSSWRPAGSRCPCRAASGRGCWMSGTGASRSRTSSPRPTPCAAGSSCSSTSRRFPSVRTSTA